MSESAVRGEPNTNAPPWKYRIVPARDAPSDSTSRAGRPPRVTSVVRIPDGTIIVDINAAKPVRNCSTDGGEPSGRGRRNMASIFSRCCLLIHLSPAQVDAGTLYAMASTTNGSTAELVRLFADLVRCETRLYNALNDRLRERHGIVTSQFEFLRYLREHPAARVADVAAEFAIGIGATSKGVDRLEKQGWVIRRPNPADRRSSLLTLTEQGTRLVDAAEPTFDKLTTGLITGALTGNQVFAVAEALSLLRSALERDQVGMPTG